MYLIDLNLPWGWRTGRGASPSLLLPTYFRSMLRSVLNLELSSDLSDTYASGLEVVVVVSGVDAMEVAGDGAGEVMNLFEGGSPDEGELMLNRIRGLSPCVGEVEGRVAVSISPVMRGGER